MNRRDVLTTLPAGIAVTAAGLISTPIAAQSGAGAGAGAGQVTAAQRFRIGDMVVTALSDGYIELGRNVLFGISDEDYAALLDDAFVEGEAVRGAVNAYLVESNGERWLIDTGTGNGLGPTLGELPANLAAIGVMPADIDRIIITHMHPDHIGGALVDGQAVYPNAEMMIGSTELNFWNSESNKAAAPEATHGLFDAAAALVAAYGERITPVGDETDLLPGVDSIKMHGHTPGHTGVMLSSGKDSLLVFGDAIHVPQIQLQRPDVTIAYDFDQSAAATTRAQVLDRAAADRQMIAGIHMGFPGIGHIERRGNAYGFVPAPWEYF